MLTDKDKGGVFDQRRSRVMARLTARHGNMPDADATAAATAAKLSAVRLIDNFMALKSTVDQLLESGGTDDGQIAEQLANIQQFLTERGAEMPAYDFRRATDLMADLRRRHEQRRSTDPGNVQAAFSFKRRPVSPTKVATAEVGDVFKNGGGGGDITDSAVGGKRNPTESVVDEMLNVKVDLTGVKNGSRTIADCTDRDVLISDLDGCRVWVTASPSTLHLANLRQSTVICCPVRTSVFVENCQNCTVAVGCQQLRVHTSHKIKFYLHVTSGAIIEQCTEVSTAPYAVEGVSADRFAAVGLDSERNVFDKVQDFDWLAQTPSPNWSVLPAEQRETFRLSEHG